MLALCVLEFGSQRSCNGRVSEDCRACLAFYGELTSDSGFDMFPAHTKVESEEGLLADEFVRKG